MFACNCLNVVLEANKSSELVTKEFLDFSDDDQCDDFDEDQWSIGIARKCEIVLPGLLRSKQVGPWVIHHCLNCDIYTHAVNKKKGARVTLMNVKLLDEEAINNIKSSDLVSTIFNVVVNPNGVDIESFSLDTYPYQNLEKEIKDFDKIVTNFIGTEQAAVDERIRQYSEEQYEFLNTLKDKAYKEREALVKIIQNAVRQNSTEFDLSPKSPKIFGNVTNEQQSSNLSELPFSPKRPKSVSTEKKISKEIREDDMIFTFEHEDFASMKTSFHDKSADGSDCEDVEEAEDIVNTNMGGVEIPQGNPNSSYGIAKSCPVAIPIFSRAARSNSRSKIEKDEDGVGPGENQQFDIAASIKALAKSVHGDAIFGELPRPKFSTQI